MSAWAARQAVCPWVWVADAVRRGKVVARRYVRARAEAGADDLGRRAHLLLGTRRRHGAFRVDSRPATAADLGAVALPTE